MNYAKAIRIARSISGMSQAELSERSTLDRSYLSLIEGGKRKATVASLEKIAVALEIPFHLLSLLATEKQDQSKIKPNQVAALAEELTHLLLEKDSGDDSPPTKEAAPKPAGTRVHTRN
jgi:transcriptional regulator with XRE-family HTH domain